MNIYDTAENIKSKDDFILFMKQLIRNYQEKSEEDEWKLK